MSVTSNMVVGMEYVLRADGGAVLEQSPQGEPLYYLHGHGSIVEGLEEALEGTQVGDTREVIVPPEKGYGTHRDELVLKAPRTQLPEDVNPLIGMTLSVETAEGHTLHCRITQITSEHVVLDANHELADKTLHFTVKVIEVRPATEEELAHGHVHGPGGDHGH